MLLRAEVTKGYLVRLAIVALVGCGFALWALYDGFIAYPNQRERALKFQKLREEDRIGDWRELCNQRGWPTDNPGKPKTEGDIFVQYTMAGAAGPFGLLFGFFLFRNYGRWVEADEKGLRASWGHDLQFDQIVMLDKKKWDSKGIARVYYEQDERTGRMYLDDFKYDCDVTREILRMVEENIGLELIVNGLPEPPLEEKMDAGEESAADQNALPHSSKDD